MHVEGRLLAGTRFDDLRWLESIGSTNREAMDLAAAGAPEGLVVVADHQTAGRGRLNRVWEAAPGDGLLVSVLLRPTGLAPERWHLLTAAAALAGVSSCRSAAGVTATIKWPNDLMVGGRKLAGVLAESAGGAVVIGMGLNVHGGPPGAAVLDDLAGRRCDRGKLLVDWLIDLDGRLGDLDAVADGYRTACATVGQDVVVSFPAGEPLRGRAESVDGLGRLVVVGSDGRSHVVTVGDVEHVRATLAP